MPEFVGRHVVSSRDLYVLGLERAEDLPARLKLPSRRFACVVAWDARNVAAETIADLARKLLDEGAVYLCTWGPDCERVHDIIDEVYVGPDPARSFDRVVMTTWHDGEPFADAIFHGLYCSWPDPGYEEGCDTLLGLTIGSQTWTAEIRAALAAANDPPD